MIAVALIVAAGRGSRAGAGLPKQYREIGGRAVIARSIDAFRRHPNIADIVVAIHPDDVALYRAAAGENPPRHVFGGADRQETVRLGLEALADRRPDAILIHDGARPFVTAEAIQRTLDTLDVADGACAALPMVETMRREQDGLCGPLVDRDGLWRAQTPQTFWFDPILAAHRAHQNESFTDDAEIAGRAGLRVALVEGAAENVKITTPADFTWAERWLATEHRPQNASHRGGNETMMEFRVGSGFDVHAFGDNADGSNDHVMLGGVRVPHDQGLKGHSDADVGLHALTDAVLGAVSSGDIGAHFPPSDPNWRGAASDQFLRHAVEIACAGGGRVTQLDLTLICERPKIRPFVDEMRARIAEIVGVSMDRVSVKATTTESLGFTGRREGIAALASATVARPMTDPASPADPDA